MDTFKLANGKEEKTNTDTISYKGALKKKNVKVLSRASPLRSPRDSHGESCPIAYAEPAMHAGKETDQN